MNTFFKITSFVLVFTFIFITDGYSRNFPPASGILSDSTVNIKVHGACDMCRMRIENAAKGRGVSAAQWNAGTQMLTFKYDPSRTTPDEVQKRIAASGHDTDKEKADDKVYQALPACCHYRDIEKMDGMNEEAGRWISGIVLIEDNKGSFSPLQGATILWLNTSHGVVSDSTGIFRIKPDSISQKLVVSYVGYTADTVQVKENEELMVVLASGKQMGEVRITSRRKATYITALSPIRTQIMTDRELFKAACCNLSESFETNPSVDVSYNDAVTGSKQIQLLGLSGNYTQLTVENLPGPRGLATPMGLNTIAGTWVESIQLTKGIGSVANGFESIAGQINVELKKPETAEKVFANMYVNDRGKTDLNFILTQKVGQRWSTSLLLHDAFLTNKNVDFNNDGFRDQPTGNLFSAINRWRYDDGKGFMTQFGIKFLDDSRVGGHKDFKPSRDKFTTNIYGLGLDTRRYEGFAKFGYVFPGKKYKSIGLQLSSFQHMQDSYFGLTAYDAEQQNFYANLIYQSIIGDTRHRFRTGMSFVSDKYDEKFKGVNYNRTERVPGAFFEYTFSPVDKFNLVAGIRADHNNLYGWFITPRLHLRYEPVSGTTVRLSAGRGQRTANIFAENSGLFVSARNVVIMGDGNGKAYGLNAEVAWNKGISVDQKLRLFNREAMFSVDYFRNDFDNQVVTDMEGHGEIKFYNLEGKSYSNSFQAELSMQPLRSLDLRLAYRYFDVKTNYSGKLLSKPFIAPHRAFANLAYEVAGWKFDYTINYNSSTRIPESGMMPPSSRSKSPDYFLMNAQVSKSLGKNKLIDIYLGGENLGNFYQKDAIVSADDPFGPHFDASMIWGPVSGRLVYLGWRYRIK